MNISWVIAEGYQFDPTVDIDTIKDIGPIWGSWTTWRGCGTDNVVCNDTNKAQELIEKQFHRGCNFYIPNDVWKQLNQPNAVRSYGGSFSHNVQQTDDIIALHLSCNNADIILMLGFHIPNINDAQQRHYYGHVLSVIKNHSDIQWVFVDHNQVLDKNFKDLPNLTCDTLGNVLQLLAQ